MTDQYLECGHPKACEREDELGLGAKWCAACERGGWVLDAEGTPEMQNEEGRYVFVCFILEEGAIGAPTGTMIWPCWYDETCGFEPLPDAFISGTVHAWMYWPSPPPLPEGE